MDFPYFKEFFKKQEGAIGESKRKYITIFTYDNDSEQQIKNNFRESGINLRDLMQRNNMTFIETKPLNTGDGFELRKWNDLLAHLKQDSQETEQENIRRIENMLL
jgi:hypothetical protein